LEPSHTVPATEKIAEQVGQGDPIKHGVHMLLGFRKDT
jgi:hypothetical protein